MQSNLYIDKGAHAVQAKGEIRTRNDLSKEYVLTLCANFATRPIIAQRGSSMSFQNIK